MSGYPQGAPMHPGSTDHQGAAGNAQQMPAGQMPWMGAGMPGQPQMSAGMPPGFMNPAMMQAAMAAFQQGQGAAAPGGVPQMYFPGMQQQPGVAAMQVPMTMQMPTPVSNPAMPAQAPAPAQAPMPTPEDAERLQAIQTMVQSLSQVEREYYLFLWQEHCGGKPLEGKDAFIFLSKSKLGNDILKRIWDLADWQKKRHLRWEDFVVTMKLISAAQKKQLISLERVLQNCSPNSMDCPEFDGIDKSAFLARAQPVVASQPEGMAALDALQPEGMPAATPPQPEGMSAMASMQPEGMSAMPSMTPEGMPAMTPIQPEGMPAMMGLMPESTPAVAAPPAMTSPSSMSAPSAMTAPQLEGMAALPAMQPQGGDALFGSSSELPTMGPPDASGMKDLAETPAPASISFPTPVSNQLPASKGGASDFGALDFAADFQDAAPSQQSAGSPSGAAPPQPLMGEVAPSRPTAAADIEDWGAFGGVPSAASAKPAATTETEDWGAFDGAQVAAPAAASADAAGNSEDWGAFGGAQSAAPPPPPPPPSTAENSEDWGAFGGAPASAPAPEKAWDAFGEPAATAPAAAASAAPGAADAWDAFGEPAGATGSADAWDAFQAPPAQAASSTGQGAGPGQGDLWSKMSAFDDLLREDDVIPAPSVADAGAGNESAAVEPSDDMPEKSADDWGDFANSAPAPATAASVPLADQFAADFGAADNSAESWGDFEASAAAPSAATAPVPVPLAADFAADFAQAEQSTDDWGAFETSTPVQEAPAAAAPPEFSADFGDFGGAPVAPAAMPSTDFTADFGDFGGAPADAGSVTAAAPASLSDVDWPSAEPAAASGDWAAFGESPPAGVQAVDEAPMPAAAGADSTSGTASGEAGAASELFFDDDKAEPSGASPGLGASASDANTVSSSSAAPAVAEAEWGAFGEDDDGMDFVSATPAAVAPELAAPTPAPDADASDWSAEFTGAPGRPDSQSVEPAPAAPPAAVAESPPPAFAFQESVAEAPSLASADPAPSSSSPSPELPRGPEDEEHRRLARGLADLGLYEDAQRCQARSDILRRLSDAEARKKAAIETDDLEAAIEIRSEIKALNSELTSAGDLEAWHRMVASGERDAGLDGVSERLRQRCQFVESAASRAALCMAIGNFRKVCPPRSAPDSLVDLSGLIRRRRRAWQMSRAIDHVSSADCLLILQVLLVCLGAMGELLGACTQSLRQLASTELSQEERRLATSADELRDHIRGLCSLRRLNWRFSLSAELFLPNGVGIESLDVGELPAEDAQRLEEIHKSTSSRLKDAKAAWASVERELAGLQLELGEWEPDQCYEVNGGSCPSTAGERHTAEPLCVLCLLPAVHIGSEAPADTAVASALWKKGVWHVQCANFWIRHGATSNILKERGLTDPFKE